MANFLLVYNSWPISQSLKFLRLLKSHFYSNLLNGLSQSPFSWESSQVDFVAGRSLDPCSGIGVPLGV